MWINFQTFCNHYSVSNISPNETYNVTLWTVDGENIEVSKSLTVLTPEKGKIPRPVTNVSINLIPKKDKYEADIEWSPAEGEIIKL